MGPPPMAGQAKAGYQAVSTGGDTVRVEIPMERMQLERTQQQRLSSIESESGSMSSSRARKEEGNFVLSVAYGLVAAAMCAPVMMSFASIIFGDPTFREHMPLLVKLVLFSSAIHQLCYVLTSTLPFAVGQVQDAGLIFLSAMARRVVVETNFLSAAGRAAGGGAASGGGAAGGGELGGVLGSFSEETRDSVTTAAALWTLGLATAGLGCMLVLVGRLKLASLAQYLPVPVVGGYLAYIGFYCGQAGLAMMARVELVGLRDWGQLGTTDALWLVAPGFGVAAAIKCVGEVAKRKKASRTARALVIPAVLAATVAIFYAVLLTTGTTLQDARTAGWVGEAPAKSKSGGASSSSASASSSRTDEEKQSPNWRSIEQLEPWTLYAPESVKLRTIFLVVLKCAPRVAIIWVGMVLVVAFSSSLDVAAIEMELGRPLDYDSELQTVGLGNVVSGVFGGYSGSYIFSQTILNLRSNVADRRSGVVVASVELALVFLLPVPPTALAPTCAFGGTLLVIAVELCEEWLVLARSRFAGSEYAVLLFTFVAIHLLGLEAGFAAGLVCAALAFAAKSAGADDGSVVCTRARTSRSVVMRDFEQRAVLSDAVRRGVIAALELRGFVFFGAAAALLAKVLKQLNLNPKAVPTAAQTLDASLYARLRRRRQAQVTRQRSNRTAPKPPRFVVLDCDQFAGVDATAARACFLPLFRHLKDAGSVLLFAGLRAEVERTLTSHGVYVDPDARFPTLDDALESAENALLKDQLAATYTSFRKVPRDLLAQFAPERLQVPDAISPSPHQPRQEQGIASAVARVLSPYTTTPTHQDHGDLDDVLVAILAEYLFVQTESADAGCADLVSPRSDTAASSSSRPQQLHQQLQPQKQQRAVSSDDRASADVLEAGRRKLSAYFSRDTIPQGATLYAAGQAADSLYIVASGIVDFEFCGDDGAKSRRILRVTKGGLVGELNFFLKRPQRFAARAARECAVFVLSRAKADAMRANDPALYIVVQTALLKNLCLQVEDSLGSLSTLGSPS